MQTRMLSRRLWVKFARHAVAPMTAGLPPTADPPLQGCEMAKSAISGHHQSPIHSPESERSLGQRTHANRRRGYSVIKREGPAATGSTSASCFRTRTAVLRSLRVASSPIYGPGWSCVNGNRVWISSLLRGLLLVPKKRGMYAAVQREPRCTTIKTDAWRMSTAPASQKRILLNALRLWLIPLTQVALDVVCREVGRVRSPGRTPDG